MSQTHPFQGILQRVDSSVAGRQPGPDEKVVVLDGAEWRTLERAPWLTLGKDIRYFRVATGRRVKLPEQVCRIRSPSTSRWLNLLVSCEAWCPDGKERALVLALGGTDHPVQQVAQLVERCLEDLVEEHWRDGRDVALELPGLRSTLEREIARRVAQETGLALAPEVRPRLDGKLGPVAVETGSFEVRPTDGDRPVVIEAATEAEVEPGREMQALLYYGALSQLSEQVRESLRRQVAESITLQELSEWRSRKVDERLMARINETLRPTGRRLEYLRLNVDLDRPPQEVEEIQHVVGDCSIRDLDETILVRHKLIVRLEDLGKLTRSGVQDVESWIRTRLDRITRSILFEEMYLDLLGGRFADDIKTAVHAAAEEIGYSVQHMVTVPELEPLSWKDGIDFECPDGSFATADSRVEVRMDIVVQGRIPESELGHPSLKPYLRPGSEIVTAMKKAVSAEAQRVLHNVDPQEYYMGFNRSFRDGAPSVREQLEEQLGELLRERFRVHDLSVIPKARETDLTDRAAALMRGPQYLDVPCWSLHLPEEVVFHLVFQVVGIADWHHFCLRQEVPVDDELAEIRKALTEETLSLFGSVPKERLLYQDRATQAQLARLLGGCWQKICQGFGLEVRITNLWRGLTRAEAARQGVTMSKVDHAVEVETTRCEALREELEHLYDRKLQLLKAGTEPADQELQATEQRIDRIHRDLAVFTGQENGRAVPHLPPSRPAFRAEDYKQPLFPSEDDGRKLGAGETHGLPEGEGSEG